MQAVIWDMTYILFRYLHLLAVLALAGGIVIENMAIKPAIDSEDARNLARVDAVCGVSSLVLIACGLLLWFVIGKPADFYSVNPVFHAKMALVIVLLLLASYPAVFFFRHRNFEGEKLDVPKAVRLCLRLEIAVVILLPILATLMARGIGIPS